MLQCLCVVWQDWSPQVCYPRTGTSMTRVSWRQQKLARKYRYTSLRTSTQLHPLRTQLHLVGFLTEPYPHGVREGLARLSISGTVGDVCRYNMLLGRLFAQTARTIVGRCGMNMEEIDLIGSHW